MMFKYQMCYLEQTISSLLSQNDYNTCIHFIPSKVTKELVKTIVDMRFAVTTHYYHHVIPSNTHHPPHMLLHTSLIRTSNKEQGNNMHLLIHQEHNKDSDLIDHPIKQKIHHIGITNMAIITIGSSYGI